MIRFWSVPGEEATEADSPCRGGFEYPSPLVFVSAAHDSSCPWSITDMFHCHKVAVARVGRALVEGGASMFANEFHRVR